MTQTTPLGQPKPAGLLRPVATITIFSALNMVAGFALQVVLAAQFGAGAEMDSYLTATSIPTLLTLVLLGSLNITFIPVFVEYEVKGNEAEAWHIVSGLLNLGALVLGGIVLFGIIAAPILVMITAPGFQPGSATFETTVYLLRLSLPPIFFNGLAGSLGAIYYARRQFTLPAMLPVLNNALILGTTIVLSNTLGITSIAIGAMVGSVAQFALVVPIMLTQGRYQPYLSLRHPGIRQVLLLMLPWIASALVYKANPLIDRFVASFLPAGSISILGYAYKLMTTTVVITTQGISTTLFPLLSRYAAERDWENLRRIFFRGMRYILLIVVPVGVSLIVLREPIIKILYERGAFTHQAAIDTGWALIGYMGAFLVTSVGMMLTPVFYALQDTYTTAKVSVIGAILNGLLAVLLSKPLGYIGPAIAYSLAATFNFALQIFILHNRLNLSDSHHMKQTTIKIFAISSLVGGLLLVLQRLGALIQPTSTVAEIIKLASIMTLGGLGYWWLTIAFGFEEACLLARRVKTSFSGGQLHRPKN